MLGGKKTILLIRIIVWDILYLKTCCVYYKVHLMKGRIHLFHRFRQKLTTISHPWLSFSNFIFPVAQKVQEQLILLKILTLPSPETLKFVKCMRKDSIFPIFFFKILNTQNSESKIPLICSRKKHLEQLIWRGGNLQFPALFRLYWDRNLQASCTAASSLPV